MQPTTHAPPIVKIIGGNGQISLGKQYAGRQVMVEAPEDGVWLIRTATVVPDNERWVHEPDVAQSLKRAIAWSDAHPASDANTDDILQTLTNGKR
jgi:hypothetical protein